jgi:hypothetical protein
LGLSFFIAKWRIFATKKLTAPNQSMFGRNFAKNKNQKFKNKMVFGGFQSPKVRGGGGGSKNHYLLSLYYCLEKTLNLFFNLSSINIKSTLDDSHLHLFQKIEKNVYL